MKAFVAASDCRVFVLGLGLIGGSFAARLRQVRPRWTVTGFDTDVSAMNRAIETRLIDQAAADCRSGAAAADVIVLAVPVGAILGTLPVLPGMVPHEAVVLDVGSTKGAIVHAMDSLPPNIQALGGHPMTGAKTAGVSGPVAHLFEDRPFVLCPARYTSAATMRWARELLHEFGARVCELDAAEHDRAAAIVSHLPYLMGVPLLDVFAEAGHAARTLAAGGFRARVEGAGANVPMWADIMFTNRDAIAAALAMYRQHLELLEERVRSAPEDELRDLLARAAAAAEAVLQAGETPRPG